MKPRTLLSLLALFLPACAPVLPALPAGATLPATLTLPAAQATAVLPEFQGEPAVLEQAPQPGLEAVERPAQPPTPQPDPLRFVFPTPKPAPVSAWRPPLYPTPWAPTQYDHFFFARPIAADEINWPLADYRYGGIFFPGVVHTGIDIPAPRGTPVLAAGPGRVTWAGNGLYYLSSDAADDPYGLAVAIKHDFGYQGQKLYTVYGHMDEVLVAPGQHVEGGDVIGLVGDTGKVTGVHLHFEVRLTKNNFYGSRNPELWLAPPQGWGVLVGRVTDSSGDLLPSQNIEIHNRDTGQNWDVKTYGAGSTNSDPYYRENVAIGDLPAGNYEIWISYNGSVYNQDLQINPGMITYFTFHGMRGFKLDLPPAPGADFVPPEAAAASLP